MKHSVNPNYAARKEYYQKRYQENKDRFLAVTKEYRAHNRQEQRDYSRAYYDANKAEVILKHLKYQTTLNGRYNAAKTKSKQRNIAFELSKDEYAEITKHWLCHYCGNPLNPTGYGLDRKNNERYYKVENAVPCCKRCNVTFSDNFNYAEKLALSKVIREIDKARNRDDSWLHAS